MTPKSEEAMMNDPIEWLVLIAGIALLMGVAATVVVKASRAPSNPIPTLESRVESIEQKLEWMKAHQGVGK